LSSNNLQALAAHNFRSMPALRSLSLYHNGVETVHPDSFAMLPQLEALDLSHNKVKVVRLMHAAEVLAHHNFPINDRF
jgi:Leucine-rich repeat (LRR) protein